jgi:hypothetical protein
MLRNSKLVIVQVYILGLPLKQHLINTIKGYMYLPTGFLATRNSIFIIFMI